jgi:2-oxoglutarate dehydrogenase E1 component
MAPKSLLRHKLCVSDLSEMGETSTFHRILWDDEDPTDDENRSLVKDHEIKRVILCSGKVYYDLIEERKKRRINNIYVMRVEQIYPFPFEPLNEDLGRFVNADFVWCQEEPRNMGAWTYTIEPMQKVLEGIGRGNERVLYAGRVESASPATGLMSKHIKEHNNLIENALNIQNKMAKARKKSSKASVNKN